MYAHRDHHKNNDPKKGLRLWAYIPLKQRVVSVEKWQAKEKGFGLLAVVYCGKVNVGGN